MTSYGLVAGFRGKAADRSRASGKAMRNAITQTIDYKAPQVLSDFSIEATPPLSPPGISVRVGGISRAKSAPARSRAIR